MEQTINSLRHAPHLILTRSFHCWLRACQNRHGGVNVTHEVGTWMASPVWRPSPPVRLRDNTRLRALRTQATRALPIALAINTAH